MTMIWGLLTPDVGLTQLFGTGQTDDDDEAELHVLGCRLTY